MAPYDEQREILNMQSNIQLMQGDCLERMKEIPSGSVDLTVTSPPYDNLRSYNGNNAEWSDNVWAECIQELYRVTKFGGVVVWVVADATIKGSETGSSFRQALWAMDCGFNLHDTMIYKKEGPPLTHNRYEQKFEYMFVFSVGKPNTFNGLREPSKYAGDSRKSKTMRQDSDSLSSRCAKGTVSATKLKGNVFEYFAGYDSSKGKERHKHPATFPDQLANDHISSWSNEGDVVFDPFLGSGTTGVAAKNLNRDFIGIELDETYFNIAKERINKS